MGESFIWQPAIYLANKFSLSLSLYTVSVWQCEFVLITYDVHVCYTELIVSQFGYEIRWHARYFIVLMFSTTIEVCVKQSESQSERTAQEVDELRENVAVVDGKMPANQLLNYSEKEDGD